MSEIKTLEIPKWGLSMDEGTIAQWLIQEGESFSKGQEICEIETTKIVNVLEAPFASTLRKIIAKTGDTLKVGAFIAICADDDISDEKISTFIQSLNHASATDLELQTNVAIPGTPTVAQETIATMVHKQPPSMANDTVNSNGYVIPLILQGYQYSDAIFATPHAWKLAEKHQLNLNKISGTGRQGRIGVKDIQAAVQANGGSWPDVRQSRYGQAVKSTADDSQILATPVARRLAKQWGINLHDCRVSGSRGRISKQDVEAVYYREHHHTEALEGVAPVAKSTVTPIAMNSMRKAIASRLQMAKRNAPHFRLSIDLNMDAMQQLRQQINHSVPQVKLSMNDMLIKATAATLMKVPQVNVQFDEQHQQILQFAQADIAVAVAIDNGLITPIVKAANSKSLAEISNDMRDLTTRAKTGKLTVDEFQGGSFSISNLGMLGIRQFDAIINPPQAAILALGMAESRAVIEDQQIVIRQMLTVTLSCDHRVIDGALGAKFLAAFKQFVENPALILL